jgi:hypothetical protein
MPELDDVSSSPSELDDVSLPPPVSELDNTTSPPLVLKLDEETLLPPMLELDGVPLLLPVSELLLTPVPVFGLLTSGSSLILDEHPKSKQTATSKVNANSVLTKCFDDIEHFSSVLRVKHPVYIKIDFFLRKR